MNKLLSGIMLLPAVLMGLTLLSGCNVSGSYKDDDKEIDFGKGCCNDLPTYQADVLVSDVTGARLAGVPVELTITTVPEQRYAERTDGDGFARFSFKATPGITAIAYACAPGYECNTVNAETTTNSTALYMIVVLNF